MTADRQGGKGQKRRARPLDRALLDELALTYVARFATSAGKLRRYLKRKLAERGWEDEGEPDVDAVVAACVTKGFVDDELYARAKASDLLRRGYGGRRVRQALGEAGIAESVSETVAPGHYSARAAVVRLADRRGFGPFGREEPDRERREKQIAAMLRAGHSFADARFVAEAASEQAVTDWLAEAAEEDDESDAHPFS